MPMHWIFNCFFYRLLIVLSYYFSPQVPLCVWVKIYFVLVCQKRGITPTNTTSFDMNIFKNNNKKFLSQDTIFLHQRFPPFPPPFYFSSAKYLPPSFLRDIESDFPTSPVILSHIKDTITSLQRLLSFCYQKDKPNGQWSSELWIRKWKLITTMQSWEKASYWSRTHFSLTTVTYFLL